MKAKCTRVLGALFDREPSTLTVEYEYQLSTWVLSTSTQKMVLELYSSSPSLLNRLTDIFAEGKFDYGVMVRYQNLTRKPELFWAP